MEGRVKVRAAGSVPNTLGRQVGVLPMGNTRGPRRTSDRGISVAVSPGVKLGEPKPPPESFSLHSAQTITSGYQRKGSNPSLNSLYSNDSLKDYSGEVLDVETKISKSPKMVSARAKNFENTKPPKTVSSQSQKTDSAKYKKSDSSRSKPDSGRSPRSDRFRVLSSGSQVSLNNYKSLPGSSRSSATSSRVASTSSRRRESKDKGRIHLAAGTDAEYDVEDSDNLPENDIKFINVETSSRPVSTLSSSSRAGGTSSASSRRDETGRKPHKTIDSAEVLSQSMELDFLHVYEISQHACELTVIDNLEKFKKVKVLDLSCNFIHEIQNLDSNKDLRELKLYDNRIGKIENLDHLRELNTLQLQHNKIKSIGKGLQSLKKLKVLRLDCNRLLKIDTPEIASCVQITSLDVSYNMLDSLTALNYLPNLEELNASGNRLRTVSDLTKCRRLQEVDVSGNGLTDLAGLRGLPNLQILRVTSNNLTSLKSLGKLKGLQDLHAGSNKLYQLSTFPAQFPALEVLDIVDNEVTDWDEVCCLEEQRELVEVFLSGNPFSAQDGDMPQYFSAIQAVLPRLEIVDGVHIKRQTAKANPIMRPMTASSIVSLRQMDSQMRSAANEMETLERSLEDKFESLRRFCDSLPAEPPISFLSSVPPSPYTDTPTPSLGRSSRKSRLRDAMAFAASVDYDQSAEK